MICLSYTSTQEITDLYQNVQSFLARIKYIAIEQEIYCFLNAIFFQHFQHHSRENWQLVNTVFWKFTKWRVINLRRLTERRATTFQKQLINLLYHIFCCNMFVFACSIIAKSQCWLFALRANIRICPHMSVFAPVFNFQYLQWSQRLYTLLSKYKER